MKACLRYLPVVALLWSASAVGQTTEDAAKINSYAVMEGADQQLTKTVGFAVLTALDQKMTKAVGFTILCQPAATCAIIAPTVTSRPPGTRSGSLDIWMGH